MGFSKFFGKRPFGEGARGGPEKRSKKGQNMVKKGAGKDRLGDQNGNQKGTWFWARFWRPPGTKRVPFWRPFWDIFGTLLETDFWVDF